MFEQNAKITRTSLGTEDHGILSAWLYLEFEGGGQAFGGWALDGARKTGEAERTDSAACGAFISGVLRTVEIDLWEKLPGTIVRIRRHKERDTIIAIGHAYKDRWFEPDKVFQNLLNAGNY